MPRSTERTPVGAVTRKDVARYAGVSTAVVSYVLNDSPRPVAEETKRRVLEAVRLLGYRPNPAARALSLGHSDVVALIVPDQRNPYFADLAAEVDRAAAERALTLLVLSEEHRRLTGTAEIPGLSTQSLRGVLAATTLTPAELEAIARNHLPLVFINQFGPLRQHPSVGAEFLAGARLATRHLIELGHERIAFIGHPSELDPRERGWRSALTEAGLPLGPVFHTEFTLAGGFDAGSRVLAEGAEATAIFAASDQLATGVLSALSRHGVDVPARMSVVGFDGIPEGAYTVPPLTSIEQDVARMANHGLEMLVGDAPPSEHVTVPVRLLERASTAPPR